MLTIRGIPNPVSSLSPIEVTTRGLAARAAVAANFGMPSAPQSAAPRADTLADCDDYQGGEIGIAFTRGVAREISENYPALSIPARDR